MLPVLAASVLAAAGWATADAARIAQGKEIFETACAACHGRDGRGNPEWENPVRPPDLADCATTAETTEAWQNVITKGGPANGLHSVMPAFGEAYKDAEIATVVAYLRTLCPTADRYPPGDLNFRRLLHTDKAFPEQEVVLSFGHRPAPAQRETELEVAYENRLGARVQWEVTLPVRARASGSEGTGVGDVEVEGKYVLGFDPSRRDILAAGLGATLPTGSESKGLGSGTAFLSPFVSFGKGFGGGRTFFQSRVGAEIPTRSQKASSELSYGLALSRALGRPRLAWTPAVEWTGTYDTRTKEHEYALWVELSKPFNKLGHVIASVGAQIPIRPKQDTYRIEGYLLWDFGDGPLWVGW